MEIYMIQLSEITPQDAPLIGAREFAELCAIHRRTLTVWRREGRGPQFHAIGRRRLYRQPPKLLNTAQASKKLGISVTSLKRRRQEGRSPRWVRIDGAASVRYAASDIEKFIELSRG